jgi:hypothetical protein
MMRVDSLGFHRPLGFVGASIIACMLVLVTETRAMGQCERDSAQAPLPADNDWYGNTVAISGDFAAAGWYTAEFNGVRSGAVVMYQREAATGQWKEHSTLVPADNQAGDGFGTRVAMDGDVLVASARWDDDNGTDAGSAYVYRLDHATDQWLFEAKLLASDGAAGDDFGVALAVRDDLILIGASNLYGYEGTEQAYIFRAAGTGWQQEAILKPSMDRTSFGSAVAIADSALLVSGRWYDEGYGRDPPVEWVEVYERDRSSGTWRSVQILLNPLGQLGVMFGATLAADSDLGLVGSAVVDHTHAPPVISLVGFAFSRDVSGHWIFVQQMTAASIPPVGVWIVRWLAIDNGVAVIGTTSPLGSNHGVVTVFQQSRPFGSWESVATIGPSKSGGEATRFGFSVDLDRDRLIVGAPEYDWNSSTIDGPGSVYFIDLHGDDCNRNSLCDDLDIVSGVSLDRNGNGVPDECEHIAGDITGDGIVNIDDLLALVTAWGPCPTPPVACPADIAPAGGDQFVNIDDLLVLLSNWST